MYEYERSALLNSYNISALGVVGGGGAGARLFVIRETKADRKSIFPTSVKKSAKKPMEKNILSVE
jgi:hypothetical protein